MLIYERKQRRSKCAIDMRLVLVFSNDSAHLPRAFNKNNIKIKVYLMNLKKKSFLILLFNLL